MKKMILSLLLLLALLTAATPAGAETVPLINDEADLLTESEEAALYETMLPLCEYGVPLFWTTTAGGNHRLRAEQYYYQQLGNESGLLLVIDMGARQLTVLSDGAIYRVITPGEADTIADNVYRLASRGDYAACATQVFTQALKLLRGEQIARPMKLVSNILLALVLSLMLVYLYISHRYENRPKTGKIHAALPVTAAGAAAFSAVLTAGNARMTKQRKVNIRSEGGHGFHGGGHSGGGGGGFSGGGGSHGF